MEIPPISKQETVFSPPASEPINRSSVYSESSMESCGCFNAIYSFFASIWNYFFGSNIELNKELAQRLAKSPDCGKKEYIELFDAYAKVDSKLALSPDFARFHELFVHELTQAKKLALSDWVATAPDFAKRFVMAELNVRPQEVNKVCIPDLVQDLVVLSGSCADLLFKLPGQYSNLLEGFHIKSDRGALHNQFEQLDKQIAHEVHNFTLAPETYSHFEELARLLCKSAFIARVLMSVSRVQGLPEGPGLDRLVRTLLLLDLEKIEELDSQKMELAFRAQRYPYAWPGTIGEAVFKKQSALLETEPLPGQLEKVRRLTNLNNITIAYDYSGPDSLYSSFARLLKGTHTVVSLKQDVERVLSDTSSRRFQDIITKEALTIAGEGQILMNLYHARVTLYTVRYPEHEFNTAFVTDHTTLERVNRNEAPLRIARMIGPGNKKIYAPILDNHQ